MSAASSKPRPLKHLSLLRSSSPLSSPSSFAPDSPVVTSKHIDLKLTHSNDDTVQRSLSSCLPSPTSGRAAKNSRRQSSIYYVSQDREYDLVPTDVRSPANERVLSSAQARFFDGSSEATVKRRNTTGDDEQAAPKVLVEKHADLLRFIAKKESRCLELRSQLATEENELLALKRKWERIVSRQIKRESSTSISSLDADSSVHNNMFSGFKEGVHGVGRLLAHLGEIGVPSSDTDSGHMSNSSISNITTNSSSTRLSQSSISSLGTAEEQISLDQANTYSDARDSDAKRQRHSVSSATRRRPYEPSSPSTPSSSVAMPQTPLSASPLYNQTSGLTPSRSQTTDTVSSMTRAKHMKRLSAVSGSLPPASSIPGISVTPLASWVEGVSKRLVSQVTSPSTSAFLSSPVSGKHTSTILSHGVSSIFSSLSSPARTTQSNSRMINLSTPVPPSLLDDDDMLGEEGGVQWAGVATLSPERPNLALAPIPVSRKLRSASSHSGSRATSKEGEENAKDSDSDSEEWNW